MAYFAYLDYSKTVELSHKKVTIEGKRHALYGQMHMDICLRTFSLRKCSSCSLCFTRYLMLAPHSQYDIKPLSLVLLYSL